MCVFCFVYDFLVFCCITRCVCSVLFAVQDIVFQLQRLVAGLARYHNDCHDVMKGANMFPIEVDLSQGTFTYDTSNQFNDEDGDDDDDNATPTFSTEYTDNPGGGNTGRYTDSVTEIAQDISNSLILTD